MTAKNIEKRENEKSLSIIIFGATGDLTKRKLIPALFTLNKKGIFPRSTNIVCVARRILNKEEFIQHLQPESFIKHYDEEDFSTFAKKLHYFQASFDRDSFAKLSKSISELEKNPHSANRIFYMATPPSVFSTVLSLIHETPLAKGRGWKRIVFEKPFGYDLESSKKLNNEICRLFKEEQIYRIDHYLGKELVQNIMTFRFENAIFEELWSGRQIDNVQITFAETLGVEGRGSYYEKAGALRDIVQNHIMQIISLVAMERPESIHHKHLRNEKVKVLNSLKPLSAKDVVFGQYGRGKIHGQPVPSYREEEGVRSDSKTETFVALKTFIETPRWEGVPFYIRTGKRLKEAFVEVNLIMKNHLWRLFSCSPDYKGYNVISVRIQPQEGIAIGFNSKIPGSMLLHPVTMEFCHSCEFGTNTPEAYEKLISDIIAGDQTLFTRWDEVEASWRYLTPLLTRMKRKNFDFPNYEAGTMGPPESFELLKKDRREWVSVQRKLTV